MYYYVYMTTNLINGKRYIGQHSAKTIDNAYLGSGSILKKAIKKYGKENFSREILEFATSKEALDDLEIKYIRQYNADKSPEFYNIGSGGKSGNGTSRYGKDNPMYGKKGFLNPKFGTKVSEYTKELLSKTVKEQYKNGRIPPMLGKHWDEETKRKISQSHKGKGVGKDNPNYNHRWSQEKREKMSKDRKESGITAGANNGRAKAVVCVETGTVYECATYAAKELHCCRHQIVDCCLGKRETCKNYHWKYASNANTVPSSQETARRCNDYPFMEYMIGEIPTWKCRAECNTREDIV